MIQWRKKFTSANKVSACLKKLRKLGYGSSTVIGEVISSVGVQAGGAIIIDTDDMSNKTLDGVLGDGIDESSSLLGVSHKLLLRHFRSSKCNHRSHV